MPEPNQLRILLIHPEGNLANNPNLSALVALLADRGHRLTVVAPDRPFARSAHPEVRTVLRSHTTQRILDRLARRALTWRFVTALAAAPAAGADYDVVVGVDRQGLLEAEVVARRQGVPLGLISYEIFFAAECSPAFMQLERAAAARVAFAVAPDPERAACLGAEVGIPIERIVTMPVAGTDSRSGPETWARTDALARMLGRSPQRRIAVLAGSLDDWTMARELVAGIGDWPGDWALVVNERYGDRPDWLSQALAAHPDRLFALPGGLATVEQLGEVLAGADLGVALYRPTFASRYTGLNLQHIGLASGKFATYLQHGLPVLVNGDGPMAQMTRDGGLGVVIADPAEIPARLAGLDTRPMRQACREAFGMQLDARRHVDAVERAIVGACRSGGKGSAIRGVSG